MIMLTEPQRAAVQKGEPVRVMAPDLGTEVVVLRADRYEEIKEILREEEERKAIGEMAMENALGREQECP